MERAEDLAIEMYRMAGLEGSEPVGAPELARRLLGDKALRFVPHAALPGPAALARVRGAWTVFLRRGLSAKDINFCTAHELAEWFIRKQRLATCDVEALANRIAAAVVAPAPAVRRAIRAVGDSFPALAGAFVVTQSCAALRFSETTGSPLALVTPDDVRYRGNKYPWPSQDALRAGGPGLKKTRVSDAKGRVVLRPCV